MFLRGSCVEDCARALSAPFLSLFPSQIADTLRSVWRSNQPPATLSFFVRILKQPATLTQLHCAYQRSALESTIPDIMLSPVCQRAYYPRFLSCSSLNDAVSQRASPNRTLNLSQPTSIPKARSGTRLVRDALWFHCSTPVGCGWATRSFIALPLHSTVVLIILQPKPRRTTARQSRHRFIYLLNLLVHARPREDSR